MKKKIVQSVIKNGSLSVYKPFTTLDTENMKISLSSDYIDV